MLENGKLGVGVIGCGDMGNEHSYAWASIPEAVLVVAVDPDKSRALNLAERFGFRDWATDYESIIERPDVDVISVCVPTFMHTEIVIKALEAGKHVLSEKPIALSVYDALRIIETKNRCKGKFTLSFQRRHSPEYERIKELINKDELGHPIMSFVHSILEMRPKLAMHDAVTGNGGPIMDCMCHYFDFWRGVFQSEPMRVTAHGFTLAKDRPELANIQDIAPDTANICVEFESGDIGAILVSWGLPAKVNGESIWEFFGPKGLLYPGFDSMKVLRDGGAIHVIESPKMRWQITRDFADCVLYDREPRVSAEDGLIALKTSLAALESMKTGHPVSLT